MTPGWISWQISVLLLGIALPAIGQDSLFISPVDHEIVLSGSFGELRSTHFHTGLDIKPSAKESDTIRCIADGYISRIKTSRTGYGRAIYIDHPSGHTSVYAHLRSYGPKIDSLVRSLQRISQSYEIEVFPELGKYNISQGEIIGLLGNSGRSYGPHLHFEIRETASELPINPLLFGIGPEDHIAPTINYTRLYSVDQYIFEEETIYTSYQKSYSYKVPSGYIGIGFNGYDQMDKASNYNGIYNIKVFVDDILSYSHTLDTISFFEMPQIKAHVDYEAKKKEKTTITRLYTLPGNQLRIIDKAPTLGLISIAPGQRRNVRLQATDWHGNTTLRTITLIGGEAIGLTDTSSFNLLAVPDKSAVLKSNGFTFEFPEGAVSRPERINVSVKSPSHVIIGSTYTPVLKPVKVQAKISNTISPNDRSKLFLAHIDGEDIVDYGSEIIGDTLFSEVEALGQFKILKDDVAPVITPVNYPSKSGSYHTFSITDDVICKGNANDFNYKVFVNETFVACEFKAVNNILYIPKSKVGTQDQLRIEVIDRKGNKAAWSN